MAFGFANRASRRSFAALAAGLGALLFGVVMSRAVVATESGLIAYGHYVGE
ncbi:MAG: hypothetical protein O2930_04275 [Acidobacteria bacterium]|nr:hypothetical protein [Acidobacteriota bacterium]